jgi:hypothetical protein
MQAFRQHIVFRLFWLFMAVHIFNCSVDTPDAQPDYVPEDLTYNDMESVVEIVLENVLDIKDAIAEHDENDTEEGNSFNIKKDFSFHNRSKVEKINIFDNGLHITASTDYKEQFSSQFHPEIVPPPPKA